MRSSFTILHPSRWPIGPALRDERGITGLETAIILIAFVVVASVFAFTVLSTGVFSSERSKDTVFAGLDETQGAVDLRGALIATAITEDTLSTADSAWTAEASVTVTTDATDKKEGSASADLVLADAFGTGLAASIDTAGTADLTGQTHVTFRIKSTTTTSAGDIELVLDESTGCASPEAQIDVPALTADTWTFVRAAISDSSGNSVSDANKDAIACVGIEIETDLTSGSTETINVDEVLAGGRVTNLEIIMQSSGEGQAVNLAPPSDSDDDGIADSDSAHVLVVSYLDNDQIVRDLYWTRTFLGEKDNDNLLEKNEQVQINISLKGLADATPLYETKEFTLEIKPPVGGVLIAKRRTPDVIDLAMYLK
jgi:flagellin-like protein